MVSARLLLIAFASLFAGCSALPERTADVDSYAPRMYRTGSNIPVKDYGAPDVVVINPDALSPANRGGPANCRLSWLQC